MGKSQTFTAALAKIGNDFSASLEQAQLQIVSEEQALRIDMAMHQFKQPNGYDRRADAQALRLQIERQDVIGGAL